MTAASSMLAALVEAFPHRGYEVQSHDTEARDQMLARVVATL
tara:strand:+ start:670 stop:795 length:126 start_codon:yes stop_codon:yes gene_type:complete